VTKYDGYYAAQTASAVQEFVEGNDRFFHRKRMFRDLHFKGLYSDFVTWKTPFFYFFIENQHARIKTSCWVHCFDVILHSKPAFRTYIMSVPVYSCEINTTHLRVGYFIVTLRLAGRV